MHMVRGTRTRWQLWLIAWIGAAVVGVANGIARGVLYEKRIGLRRAHFVSTATLLLLLGAYMRWLSSIWPIASRLDALRIGGAWSALTVAFEFGFGHYVAHDTWSALLDQYNLARGRVWVLVPVWIAIGPLGVGMRRT